MSINIMEQVSPAAMSADIVIITRGNDIRFRTMQTFTEFDDYMKANYPSATFEFIDDFGEKVELKQDKYIEFLKTSDGYSNYLYSNLASDEKRNLTGSAINPREDWKCTFCHFDKNKPDMVKCKLCQKQRNK
jgi:hypothetical protein